MIEKKKSEDNGIRSELEKHKAEEKNNELFKEKMHEQIYRQNSMNKFEFDYPFLSNKETDNFYLIKNEGNFKLKKSENDAAQKSYQRETQLLPILPQSPKISTSPRWSWLDSESVHDSADDFMGTH